MVNGMHPIRCGSLFLLLFLTLSMPALAQTGGTGGRASSEGRDSDVETLRPVATLGEDDGTRPPGQGPVQVPGARGVPIAASDGRGDAVFRSVAPAEALMYESASDGSRKLYVAPRGMPVRVTATSMAGGWVQVRDATGEQSWMHGRDLVPRRTLVVLSPTPLLREPRPGSSTWFELDAGVLVELVEDLRSDGYARVRYLDGTDGYLAASSVWGL